MEPEKVFIPRATTQARIRRHRNFKRCGLQPALAAVATVATTTLVLMRAITAMAVSADGALGGGHGAAGVRGSPPPAIPRSAGRADGVRRAPHPVARVRGEGSAAVRDEVHRIETESTHYWRTGELGDPGHRLDYGDDHPLDVMRRRRVETSDEEGADTSRGGGEEGE